MGIKTHNFIGDRHCCIDSGKPNYHTIMTMTAPPLNNNNPLTHNKYEVIRYVAIAKLFWNVDMLCKNELELIL
jgi:hypothetical protein